MRQYKIIHVTRERIRTDDGALEVLGLAELADRGQVL